VCASMLFGVIRLWSDRLRLVLMIPSSEAFGERSDVVSSFGYRGFRKEENLGVLL
jgi:hypothetical protein